MSHLVLCGDSIFDNKAYVKVNQPDVTNQVSALLPNGSKVSRLAIDGHLTDDVIYQLDHLPRDATDIFVSAGGNDALRRTEIFSNRVRNIGDSLLELYRIRDGFEHIYSKMVNKAMSFGLPVTVCTIYYPRFSHNTEGFMSRLSSVFSFYSGSRKALQQMSMVALSVFNDVITKVALDNRLSIIDLRLLCNDDNDFANPIEPSMIGGKKIAEMIVNVSSNLTQSANKVYC